MNREKDKRNKQFLEVEKINEKTYLALFGLRENLKIA